VHGSRRVEATERPGLGSELSKNLVGFGRGGEIRYFTEGPGLVIFICVEQALSSVPGGCW
jgi:hypothetical protein